MKKTTLILLLIIICFSLTSCVNEIFDVFYNQGQQVDEQHNDMVDAQDNLKDIYANDFAPSSLEPDEIELDILVADNEECVIKITGLRINERLDYVEVGVYLENKSDDMTYMFTTPNTTINDVVVSTGLYSTVTPGKIDIAKAYINIESFARNGLDAITDIEMTFALSEEGDYNDTILTEVVRFYPYGEQNATKFERTPKQNERIILDNEYATVIFTEFIQDDRFYIIDYYVVNKTENEINFSTADSSINDYMYSLATYTNLPANSTTFDMIDIYKGDLKENNIETIEEIEMKIYVYDDKLYNVLGETEYITITSNEFRTLYEEENDSVQPEDELDELDELDEIDELEQEQDTEDEQQEKDDPPTDVLYEKPFGSYTVPSDHHEDEEYEEGMFTYIHEDDIFGFESVSIGYSESGYTVEQHEEFRDSLVDFYTSEGMLDGFAEFLGNGFYTDNGYNCYEFTFVFEDAGFYKHAYIVGEKKFIMLMYRQLSVEPNAGGELFYDMINSFTWNEDIEGVSQI